MYAVYNPPQNRPNFDLLNISRKTIVLEDFNAHSIGWGYMNRNTAAKEIEDILNSSHLESSYSDEDPATYFHYIETRTTPDWLQARSARLHNRPAGSLWGSVRSTLSTTYKMFVQPRMQLYCCKTLVTTTEAILKTLEKTHNQALRLITGGIKSTPIDAMLLVTGNGTIRSSVEKKALTLYGKLLHIPSDILEQLGK
nr:hypothetical protein HmN_000486900 [Hymenolepis microstoma]